MKIEKTFTADGGSECKISGSLGGNVWDVIGGILTASVLLAAYFFVSVIIIVVFLVVVAIGVCAIPFGIVAGIGYGIYKLLEYILF